MQQQQIDSWVTFTLIQECFDHLLKTLKWLRPNHRRAINNEGRRALHTQLPRYFIFLLNNFSVFA